MALVGEMDGLAAAGIALDRLYISHAAHVILPYHRALDQAVDQERIGTTGKGVGPAYADKAARLGDPRRRPSRRGRSSAEKLEPRFR